MITIKAEPRNFDNVEMTLSITMTFSEWNQFSTQLVETYPSWKIVQEIRRIISSIKKQAYGEIE